jgi:hypothetical protein
MSFTIKEKDGKKLNDDLLRQRKKLTDSLYYANYIQTALLPSKDD